MNSSDNSILIHDEWLAYQSLADAIDTPSGSCFDELVPLEITVPGSIFRSLATNRILVDDAEDYDWWYLCDFRVNDFQSFSNYQLLLERLATLAEVWLNDVKLLTSSNLFLPVSIDVSNTITENNTLVICFRSVNQFLKAKRPRPKWKTNLVNNQQLRWLRTSLLGRMPGWTPAKPALGPCGTIELMCGNKYLLQDAYLKTRLAENKGIVDALITISGSVKTAKLQIGAETLELTTQNINQDQLCMTFKGELIIDKPQLWWPCTHGKQDLYPCKLIVTSELGEDTIDLGARGFSSVELDTSNQRLQLRINNKYIFARGACWTITDLESFFADTKDLRTLLMLASDANMNMLRVGGTMTYETDEFYSICDELGIMIWQDFMFANMDYPVDDPEFVENITAEVSHQLKRLSQYSCIKVYCGNSEVQQQASMVGIERQNWSNVFFDKILPDLCTEYHPGIPYFPSTPYGGALPFHISEGICHFYGVGAYKKSLLASGLRDVKFTAESLGFSHVPEQKVVDAIFNGSNPVCHSPLWKQGIPRDSSAGWDFEDIRDHYIREMFNTDPVTLRSRDTLRYLAISRVVTGELIKQVIAHWRSPDTSCAGALLWFYKDLVPGAGWGLLDNKGSPKSVYYYVKQAFNPLAALLIDRGLDGLEVLIVNETCNKQHLRIEIKLLSCPDIIIEHYSNEIQLTPDSHWLENVESMIGHFRDINYSYQFGLIQHQLVTLQIFDIESDELLTEDVYFPHGLNLNDEVTANLNIELLKCEGDQYLVLQSDRFLQAVSLEIPKSIINTNYFHLLPGVPKKINIKIIEDSVDVIKGYLTALNLVVPIRIKIKIVAVNER